MMGGGSPATFSQGGNPAPYVPKAQPQADQNFQNILAQFPQTPQATPAGALYPYVLDQLQKNFLGFPGTTSSAFIPEALGGAQQAATLGAAGAPALQNAGLSILNTGFDPQNALFNRTQQQVMDQSNVANAAAGLGSSPYGASATGNNLANFDINWQNNLLNREATAAGAASPLLQAAPQLAASSQALPYSTGANIGQNALAALGSTVNLGNQQYAPLQTVLNDLESYLGLGQSASNLATSAGQMGFNQLAQGVGGALSGANSLFGSGGLFGGGSSALGGGANALGNVASTVGNAADFTQFNALGDVVGGGGTFGGAGLADAAATGALDTGATAGGGLLSALPFS